MEDISQQKLLFGGWIYYSREKKKMNIFQLISIEKSEYLWIKKIILWHYATKKRTFFKICHFLITGRVVLHNKFYKKFFSYQSYEKMDFFEISTKNFFWLAGFIILGVKKNEHFFRLISIEKVKNYLLIQKNEILWHFTTKEGNVFQNLSLFDNW